MAHSFTSITCLNIILIKLWIQFISQNQTNYCMHILLCKIHPYMKCWKKWRLPCNFCILYYLVINIQYPSSILLQNAAFNWVHKQTFHTNPLLSTLCRDYIDTWKDNMIKTCHADKHNTPWRSGTTPQAPPLPPAPCTPPRLTEHTLPGHTGHLCYPWNFTPETETVPVMLSTCDAVLLMTICSLQLQ